MGKVKKEKAIIILAIVILVVVAVSYLVYNMLKPDDIQVIDMTIKVGNYTGFDVNTSYLIFGTVVPGGYSKRSIKIKNIDDKKHNVEIVTEGELSDWTKISNNNFIINNGEIKDVDVTIFIPERSDMRKYDGKLAIIFR
ncbi:MAG: hypothetical protein U9R08_04600 [Nanoarchaeota archaeon]|nr:hypothetical protein [Nanoarchaeota archaeon]